MTTDNPQLNLEAQEQVLDLPVEQSVMKAKEHNGMHMYRSILSLRHPSLLTGNLPFLRYP